MARRLLLALLSGLGVAASFEPLAWVWLLVPAVAGLSLAVHGLRGRRAFLTGLLFGAGFMGGLLPWISVIGRDAWVGITVLEAAFYGLLGVVLGRVSRLALWPLWTAACWVGVEVLRSWVPWGGFPWGRLAFATIDTPLATAMAWVGTAGTTFLVALLGATLAWLVRELVRPDARRTLTAGLAALGVLVLAAAPALAGRAAADADGTVQVAAVQGNVPGEGMEAFAERRAVLNNHVEATLELGRDIDSGAVPKPDFVLWPENSTDIDPFEDASVYEDIQRAVNAVGVPVLVGAMVGGPGPIDVKNQSIVWSPGTGPGERYSKTHPVPFGEYIPMRKQLAQVFERLDQIPRDMVPGTEPGVLDLAGTTIGDTICFEVAYDGLVRAAVEDGAGMLVVPTNNATYMGTGQVEQQFAIARLRAVETGRTVVVVATNGVSGVVNPDGSVAQRPPVRSTQVMDTQVTLRSGITPGVRWGRSIGLPALRRRPARGGRHRRHRPPSSPLRDPAPGRAHPGRAAAARPGPHRRRPMTSRPPLGRMVMVVPTYNEADNLEWIVERTLVAVPGTDVLVVDDGSPDGTGDIADDLAVRHDRVSVVHRTEKAGLGAAYLHGFAVALERGYDVVGEMDADGSHQPEQLPTLMEALADADLVIGARWIKGGSVVNWSRFRKALSVGGNQYARLALGIPVHDVTAGFRLFRASTLRALDLASVESVGYCFQTDLTLRTLRAGLTVREVPIEFLERVRGESKMNRSVATESLRRITVWGLQTRAAQARDVLSKVPGLRGKRGRQEVAR